MGYQLRQRLLPPLIQEAGLLLNYLAFSQEIKIHWLHEPVTSSMVTIAVVDGRAGGAYNCTSSPCSHTESFNH